ncbi:hypothetical protein ACJMK2_008461 [Sinanodonta woodiana]|uniref:Uncharacterized protein n=1 Tax=Sinanodonta woodiana TaxID=1069815 RepID=A0ABD3VMG2_SINWO
MKAFIILCCIALSTAIRWDYRFGPVGVPTGSGQWGNQAAGLGGFLQDGDTVVAGPTSVGLSRGRAISTPKGTISTAVGKGWGTAPHNFGQVVRVGPITRVTGPHGSDHQTPDIAFGYDPYKFDGIAHGPGPYRGGFGFSGGNGLGGGYGLIGGYGLGGGYGLIGGYGLGGGHGGYSSGFGGNVPSSDVVAAGTSAAISARGNAEANAVGSRISGQRIGVITRGRGRPIWTPHGQIGVADSGSASVNIGLGQSQFGGYSSGSGGNDFFGGGNGGGYPYCKYNCNIHRLHIKWYRIISLSYVICIPC